MAISNFMIEFNNEGKGFERFIVSYISTFVVTYLHKFEFLEKMGDF